MFVLKFALKAAICLVVLSLIVPQGLVQSIYERYGDREIELGGIISLQDGVQLANTVSERSAAFCDDNPMVCHWGREAFYTAQVWVINLVGHLHNWLVDNLGEPPKLEEPVEMTDLSPV